MNVVEKLVNRYFVSLLLFIYMDLREKITKRIFKRTTNIFISECPEIPMTMIFKLQGELLKNAI